MNTSESGIFCPACKMRNDPNAILCSYCHTPLGHNSQKTVLLKNSRETTGILSENLDTVLDAPTYNPDRFMDFEIPSEGMILINLENGQPVAVLNEKAFILGRASQEIKTRVPLVDLTEYDAQNYGISRVHALIRQTKDGFHIVDLESTNGTWHESQRLTPKEPHPLESGDRIRLGRLHLLVYYT